MVAYTTKGQSHTQAKASRPGWLPSADEDAAHLQRHYCYSPNSTKLKGIRLNGMSEYLSFGILR